MVGTKREETKTRMLAAAGRKFRTGGYGGIGNNIVSCTVNGLHGFPYIVAHVRFR